MKTIVDFIRIKESRAVGIVFMSMAILFGAWVTRLPELKKYLEISEGQLGMALFAMPLGATVILPFFSKILRKLGERKSTLFGLSFFLLAISLPNLMTNLWSFSVSLFFVGMAMGITNVSMNACATAVEHIQKRSIMSACHGFFSLGGMVGAASASVFIGLGFSPFWHIASWAILLAVVALLWVSGYLLNKEQEPQEKKGFSLPPKSVVGLAAVGFCIMLGEGAITDWSALYLKDSLSAPATIASLGFATFAGFMALGRFFGDPFIEKFGSLKMLILGCSLGILGLVLVQMGGYGLALAGFGAVGLGFSVIVPTLFSQSARQKGVQSSVGIASVASSGYLGLLIGPVLIGFVAEHWGLSHGFTFLTALTTVAFLIVLGFRRNFSAR